MMHLLSFFLLLSTVSVVIAGEHEAETENFYDVLEEQERRLEREEEAVVQAARIAAEHQQPTGTKTTKPPTPTPITPAQIPGTPGLQVSLPIDIQRRAPELPKNVSPQQYEDAYTQLEQKVARLAQSVERVEQQNDVVAVKNALMAYKNAYSGQVKYLSTPAIGAFEPSTVLYNLIQKMNTTIQPTQIADTLTKATADPSFVSKVTSSPEKLQADANQRARAGMDAFVTTINQARTMYMLLELQSTLLEAKIKNANMAAQTGGVTASGSVDPAMYKLYFNQWQSKYEMLTAAFKASRSLPSAFKKMAKQMQNLDFVDLNKDISPQVQQCQRFKTAYNEYIKFYNGLGLNGMYNNPEPGIFSFVDKMYDNLQEQVVIAADVQQAQSLWEKLVRIIRESFRLQPSIGRQLKNVQANLIEDMQKKLYTLSLLNNAFTPPDISDAAAIKVNMDAIKALATLSLEELSITDFRTFLGCDTKTYAVDPRLSDAFSPALKTPQNIMEQYTFTRSGASLLTKEYAARFIKYRLLGLGGIADSFVFDDAKGDLLASDNDLWDVDYSDAKKRDLQEFLNDTVKWDPINKEPAIMFDPADPNADHKMLDRWFDLTQAIKVWSKQDVVDLNGLMQKPQPVEKKDFGLVGSYLLLRASMVQDSVQNQATVQNLAAMCKSFFGQAIVARALSVPKPLVLQEFKKNAQRMMKFLYGKDGGAGIAGMYAALEANYTAALLQQQNTSPRHEGYRYIPYVVTLPPVNQNIIPSPYDPSSDGGGGGHGGRDQGPKERKCYDENDKLIPCDKEDESEVDQKKTTK